jgi:membrane protein DedA with SNARE-associated domain
LASQVYELVVELFTSYGYWLVFFGLFLENIIVIGLFFPGDLVLLAGGFLASRSYLEIGYVIVLAILAAVLGNLVGYFIGRHGGRSLVVNLAPHFYQKRLEQAETYFQVHGGKAVFLARFAAGVRVFMPAIAGFYRLKLSVFFLYTTLGIIIWTLALGSLGYLFGEKWEVILEYLDKIGLAFLVLLLALVYLWSRGRRGQGGDSQGT